MNNNKEREARIEPIIEGGFIGETIHLDPDYLPALVVLSPEEVKKRKTTKVNGIWKAVKVEAGESTRTFDIEEDHHD